MLWLPAAPPSNREGRGVLAWIAAVLIALAPQHHPQSRDGTSPLVSRPSPLLVTRRVFGARWRSAWCVSYYESRHYLAARNGPNLGPWQISVTAHPWVDPWRLTHSWWYSAKAAYRISGGGRSWSPWTTHSMCGV